MKTTWRKLQIFAAVADAYLNEQKGETKISYALKRVRDQIAKHGERVQTLLADIEIDLCVVDEKDVVQRDAAGNLQFTRAGLKERNKKQQAILEQEFEIDPYYLKQRPERFTPIQLTAFAELIFRPIDGVDAVAPPEPPDSGSMLGREEETAFAAS